MNMITFATSLASSRLPDSFASLNFSSGQSVHCCRLVRSLIRSPPFILVRPVSLLFFTEGLVIGDFGGPNVAEAKKLLF
jgi:hypothetical protein